jgi:outer membrane immunogenic protein
MTASANVPGIFVGSFKDSQSHVGWTLGAGVEAMIHKSWSLKGEYLYVDFDEKAYFQQGNFSGLKTDLDQHVLRLGVNYRFNM